MSFWTPTHVQFTVLRARNLIVKGKGGNNDVFVTIQLGKEKYQTSTIRNAHNPEWFEECDLPIPHMHSEIEVQLYHRGMLSDDFLGYGTIPLWEQKIEEKAKSQWIQLKSKPSKGPDNKYRGEVEIKVTFHCQSRMDIGPGLKKRSSSIRNLATAVGDKLKFTRSKSFRENRKDPEGGKPDRHHHSQNLTLNQDLQEEGLTRSYSMSAAYIKTMSLDRGRVISLANNMDETDVDFNRAGASCSTDDVRSTTLYNIAGNRRSMVDLPSTQAPPPYRPSSHDDLALKSQTQPRLPVAWNPNNVDSVLLRERRRYESIRERTEPEESSSSDEGVQRRRHPQPRVMRSRRIPEEEPEVEVEISASTVTSSQSRVNGSREETSVTREGMEGQFASNPQSEVIPNGSLPYERSHQTGSSGRKKKSASNGQNLVNGDAQVRKRSKRDRDRLQFFRQAGRRFTIHNLDGRFSGLYDESLSEPSDSSSRLEMSEDLFSVYKNMTKEELLRVVIQNKAQLIRKDQYIKDLENYIDDLLVRVMETQPRILHRPILHHR